MKIVIINGSHRKKGATASIMNEMYLYLKSKSDVDVLFIHVSDLNLKYCIGCYKCYKTGRCIFQDDIEKLSLEIEKADGLILGTPTYASNVSAQMKTIIDRGHFIIEQLLHEKYAISVVTYENYGGRDTTKILNRLLLYSGAKISGKILAKTPYSTNPLNNINFKKNVQRKTEKFYNDIKQKHIFVFQNFKHFLIFQLGIRPFVLKKGEMYTGVIKHWKKRNIR